jgi:methionyl-tRNA synthetase
LVSNGAETSDADFSWREFRTKTNGELIGNFGNLIHRILSFIKVNFPEGIDFPKDINGESAEFLQLAEETFSKVGDAIESGRFREGLKEILKLVEHGNRYINDAAPWVTIKTDKVKTANTLAVAGHVIKSLAILVRPFLPRTAEKISNSIGWKIDTVQWSYPSPGNIAVGEITPLYKRIEEKDVERQIAKLG